MLNDVHVQAARSIHRERVAAAARVTLHPARARRRLPRWRGLRLGPTPRYA